MLSSEVLNTKSSDMPLRCVWLGFRLLNLAGVLLGCWLAGKGAVKCCTAVLRVLELALVSSLRPAKTGGLAEERVKSAMVNLDMVSQCPDGKDAAAGANVPN
jgi:hypothetical protein